VANEPAPAATGTPTTEGTPPTTPPATTDAGLTPPREGSPIATAGAGDQSQPEGEEPEGGDEPEGDEGGEPAKLTADDVKKAIELPEGVSADDALLGKFADYAAEAGLSAEQSKALASMYFEAQESLIQQLAQANQQGWDATIDAWKAEIDSDPVIGSGHQQEAMKVIGQMLDEYGTPEARRAFEVTGAGWNPHIARMIYKMGLALSEGGVHPAPAPTKEAPKTLANILYPNGGGDT
jgi:hypothetical protein